MAKYFDRAATFSIIVFGLTIIIINTYALFNGSTSLPVNTISYVLQLAVFTLFSIKNILHKNKIGYAFLAFTFVMLIIGAIKVIY